MGGKASKRQNKTTAMSEFNAIYISNSAPTTVR